MSTSTPAAGIPGPGPGDRVHPVRLLALTGNVIDDDHSPAWCQHLVKRGEDGGAGRPVQWNDAAKTASSAPGPASAAIWPVPHPDVRYALGATQPRSG